MTTYNLPLNKADPSWHDSLKRGLAKMNPAYLESLTQSSDWLPGADNVFNAFSLPMEKVNYVLFGESPYPRRASANGFAFWDADVKELWSETGLSKKVNRATSLRNILKMLLIADGHLNRDHATQDEIAKIEKSSLLQTNTEFFSQLLQKGFLLLNATLVLQPHGKPVKDAREWLPFLQEILTSLLQKRPDVKFILMGRIANTIDTLLPNKHINKVYVEHPYNISFITNPKVIEFFKPLHLLRKTRG